MRAYRREAGGVAHPSRWKQGMQPTKRTADHKHTNNADPMLPNTHQSRQSSIAAEQLPAADRRAWKSGQQPRPEHMSYDTQAPVMPKRQGAQYA